MTWSSILNIDRGPHATARCCLWKFSVEGMAHNMWEPASHHAQENYGTSKDCRADGTTQQKVSSQKSQLVGISM